MWAEYEGRGKVWRRFGTRRVHTTYTPCAGPCAATPREVKVVKPCRVPGLAGGRAGPGGRCRGPRGGRAESAERCASVLGPSGRFGFGLRAHHRVPLVPQAGSSGGRPDRQTASRTGVTSDRALRGPQEPHGGLARGHGRRRRKGTYVAKSQGSPALLPPPICAGTGEIF